MDSRSCLILLRASDAASLVLNLCVHTTPCLTFCLTSFYFFVFFLFLFLFLSVSSSSVLPFRPFGHLPVEAVLHVQDFLYKLLPPMFPWEELPVLEVIKHDGHQAHLLVGLQ